MVNDKNPGRRVRIFVLVSGNFGGVQKGCVI